MKKAIKNSKLLSRALSQQKPISGQVGTQHSAFGFKNNTPSALIPMPNKWGITLLEMLVSILITFILLMVATPRWLEQANIYHMFLQQQTLGQEMQKASSMAVRETQSYTFSVEKITNPNNPSVVTYALNYFPTGSSSTANRIELDPKIASITCTSCTGSIQAFSVNFDARGRPTTQTTVTYTLTYQGVTNGVQVLLLNTGKVVLR